MKAAKHSYAASSRATEPSSGKFCIGVAKLCIGVAELCIGDAEAIICTRLLPTQNIANPKMGPGFFTLGTRGSHNACLPQAFATTQTRIRGVRIMMWRRGWPYPLFFLLLQPNSKIRELHNQAPLSRPFGRERGGRNTGNHSQLKP